MSAIGNESTEDEIDREFQLWRTDPKKFWETTNKRVELHPDSPNAYFARHQAWERLGRLDLALADLNRALALEDHFVTHRAKGGVLHGMGRYEEAIASLNRCEQMEPANWPEALGPLIRADCHAQLGNEAAALADCETLPDDHWTPGVFGLPGGNKQEVADELRRRAAIARGRD
ncbi:MAG: tetratricopeptide repeat protein [Alphaproteobacteria bacterium]|nr:tetratricopeptide repeat protein [Alphaproteobacteria bacterium]